MKTSALPLFPQHKRAARSPAQSLAGLLPVRINQLAREEFTMPRPKLARRFEPQWGVTRPMLEVESKYVQTEVEGYMRRSMSELRELLTQRFDLRRNAEDVLRGRMNALPELQRIALQCIIARDAYHLLELYATYLQLSPTAPAVAPAVGAVSTSHEVEVALTFRESLFD